MKFLIPECTSFGFGPYIFSLVLASTSSRILVLVPVVNIHPLSALGADVANDMPRQHYHVWGWVLENYNIISLTFQSGKVQNCLIGFLSCSWILSASTYLHNHKPYYGYWKLKEMIGFSNNQGGSSWQSFFFFGFQLIRIKSGRLIFKGVKLSQYLLFPFTKLESYNLIKGNQAPYHLGPTDVDFYPFN